MTDRPILFSAPMIRALLAGRKTQTRRLVKVEAQRPIMDFVKVGTDSVTGRAIYEMKDEAGKHVAIAAGKHFITEHYSPPIAMGDRLWVKETWKPHSIYTDLKPSQIPESNIFFRADDAYAPSNTKWWPSLYMPRWASRITLAVEDVRIERLILISESDAIAEGIAEDDGSLEAGRIFYLPGAFQISGVNAPKGRLSIGQHHDPRLVYRDLINNLHGGDLWSQNPWVVAYTFRMIAGNIDA